jgi:tetratricopeptide (TPR) repeat protein
MQPAKSKIKIIITLISILLVVFIAFFHSLNNDFVNYDDNGYIKGNGTIKSLSLKNIYTLSTGFFVGHYHPLTMFSFLLEYRFFKLHPFGYHFTNLILHLLNTLLVFWFIYLISGRKSISWITAVLFGIHPLNVEAVAWISQRKSVLYVFFFLCTLICYLYYSRPPKKITYYYLSIIFFFFALLSKCAAVTLPLVLFLLDYHRKKRQDKIILSDKVVFLALSLAFGLINLIPRDTDPVAWLEKATPLLDKVKVASYVLVFYLQKLFWPAKLSCLYPYYGAQTINGPFYFSIVLLLGAFIAVSRSFTKKIVFGSAFFLIIMLPLLQFLPFGEAIVADHYVYLASIGIFYILAEGFVWLYEKKMEYLRIKQVFLLALLFLAVGTLCTLAAQRCRVWKDSVTLWTDALNKYPNLPTAHNQRGLEFMERKEYDKAQSDFNYSLSLPDSKYYRRQRQESRVYYYINLSSLYIAQGRYQEARGLLEEIIRKDPRHASRYYLNLSFLYAKMGMPKEAVEILNKGVPDTDKAASYYNLGYLYVSMNDPGKAVPLFAQCVNLDPGFYAAYYWLGILYQDAGDAQEAIGFYRKALQIKSDSKNIYNDIATAYLSLGEYKEAITFCKKAIKIDPYFARSYNNLGSAYFALGRNKEAVVWLKKAVEIEPDMAAAHSNLAYVYFSEKEYGLALGHYDKAIALGYKVKPELTKLLKPYQK